LDGDIDVLRVKLDWGSEPVDWIARELDFLKSWEVERLANRLF
jgi:hypothetical protein